MVAYPYRHLVFINAHSFDSRSLTDRRQKITPFRVPWCWSEHDFVLGWRSEKGKCGKVATFPHFLFEPGLGGLPPQPISSSPGTGPYHPYHNQLTNSLGAPPRGMRRVSTEPVWTGALREDDQLVAIGFFFARIPAV